MINQFELFSYKFKKGKKKEDYTSTCSVNTVIDGFLFKSIFEI